MGPAGGEVDCSPQCDARPCVDSVCLEVATEGTPQRLARRARHWAQEFRSPRKGDPGEDVGGVPQVRVPVDGDRSSFVYLTEEVGLLEGAEDGPGVLETEEAKEYRRGRLRPMRVWPVLSAKWKCFPKCRQALRF